MPAKWQQHCQSIANTKGIWQWHTIVFDADQKWHCQSIKLNAGLEQHFQIITFNAGFNWQCQSIVLNAGQ